MHFVHFIRQIDLHVGKSCLNEPTNDAKYINSNSQRILSFASEHCLFLFNEETNIERNSAAFIMPVNEFAGFHPLVFRHNALYPIKQLGMSFEQFFKLCWLDSSLKIVDNRFFAVHVFTSGIYYLLNRNG